MESMIWKVPSPPPSVMKEEIETKRVSVIPQGLHNPAVEPGERPFPNP